MEMKDFEQFVLEVNNLEIIADTHYKDKEKWWSVHVYMWGVREGVFYPLVRQNPNGFMIIENWRHVYAAGLPREKE
jgi:hypothetical protein